MRAKYPARLVIPKANNKDFSTILNVVLFEPVKNSLLQARLKQDHQDGETLIVT